VQTKSSEVSLDRKPLQKTARKGTPTALRPAVGYRKTAKGFLFSLSANSHEQTRITCGIGAATCSRMFRCPQPQGLPTCAKQVQKL